MLLVYILIAMLPGCSVNGQASGLLSAIIDSDRLFPALAVRVTTPSTNQAGSEATGDFSDFASAIARDERLMSIVFLASLALLFILIIYFFNRYKANRRYLAIAGTESSGGEAGVDEGSAGNPADGDISGFSSSYISTDSAPAILVAEEDDQVRLFITNTLRLNYRVIAVQDGLKAFRKAFDTIPDLVITNSLMPGMDGVSLCHLLKATMATSHIPVIILNTEDSLRPEGPVPADGCIRANFDAKSLLIEIRNFLDQRKHLYAAFRKQLQAGKGVEEYFEAEATFMQKLDHIMKSGYGNPAFGVEDLVEGLSLTKLQLFRKLKVLTNKTPGELIRIFRINEAKRLLKNENSRVSEVAMRAGFSNLSGFTKAFKEVTGITPVEYAVDTRSLTDPVTD